MPKKQESQHMAYSTTA